MFEKLTEWVKCKAGYHELVYENKEGYLRGRFGPWKCKRCGESSEGFKISPMPEIPDCVKGFMDGDGI